MPTEPRSPFAPRAVAASAAWFLTLAGAYLASIASDSRAELRYAILFGAAAALLIEVLHRADRHTFELSPRAIIILAGRALAGAAQESWLLLGPRLCAQLMGTAPEGRYIRIGVDRGRGNPEDDGRVAGVLWAQAFTPNSIPLFVERDRLVLHQLVHRREPNADDREFPA